MSKKRGRISAVIGATMVVLGLAASAGNARGFGAEPMIGEIMLVAFDFAPVGYMDANGALLPVAQNTTLFSLYGTKYGGDGRTTFGLPKLDPPLAGLKYVVAVRGIYPPTP